VMPDPAQKAAAQMEVLKLRDSAEARELEAGVRLALAQADTNTAEAKSGNAFAAGWRPFIGWVCGAGFAVQFVIGPLGAWAATLAGHPIKPPVLDIEPLFTMLAGMLGLGTLRTFEKIKGAA